MTKSPAQFDIVSANSDDDKPATTEFEADGKNYVEEREGGGFEGEADSDTPPCRVCEGIVSKPSLAEVQEAEREEHASALRFVMNRCQAVETLVEDILTLIADFNPEAVGAWRDQAAVNWQRIIDRDCPPNDVIYEALYRTRFEILESVMDRAGQPYEAAEVVDLADARAKAAVRRGHLN